MNGWETSETTGFGTVEVNGRSRVPSPPTRISACTPNAPGPAPAESAADPLVDEARGLRLRTVDEVAAVDQDPAARHLGHPRPVEVGELGPLGDDDEGVGPFGRLERRVGELDAVHQLARLLLGD